MPDRLHPSILASWLTVLIALGLGAGSAGAEGLRAEIVRARNGPVGAPDLVPARDADPLSTAQASELRGSVGQPIIGTTTIPGGLEILAGVWHVAIPGAVVGVEPPAAPRRLTLAQNVPNPFQRETRIAFTLPAADHVSLAVFDARGRRVATLVDERLEPGTYEAVVTAHGLAPGLYLYRLQSSDRTHTRKFLLLSERAAR